MQKTYFQEAVQFGRKLIQTQDLDPTYTAIHGATLAAPERARLLLAYACLYHLGAASRLATRRGAAFWEGLLAAAVNVDRDWPRGTERRHWRGKAACSSVGWLHGNFKRPEDVVASWCCASFAEVAAQVQRTPVFGPWIAFKIADLLERVHEVEVSFDNCALGVYKDPRMGAALLLTGDQKQVITDEELGLVITKLHQALGPLKAPPSYNRLINVQEVETVLCKFKSHINGHYPPGKDTKEVYHALTEQPWGRVANKLATALEPLYRAWS
jgi:Alpha-glutamyl/putrescinyl thymine pyrophosphorylase clade 2